VNFLAKRFKKTPIKKSAAILKTFLKETGFFWVVDNGIAIPIMNRNEGKIRSAGVRPFHAAWSKNHGGYGPELSTKIIPIIVSPL
jgi:hypothetical protein